MKKLRFAWVAAALLAVAPAWHLQAQEDGEDAAGTAMPEAVGSSKVDLGALKEQHSNAVVKIEFTLVSNMDQVRRNPTKNEEYYAGDDPPHGSGFFISETDILTNSHVVEDARRSSVRVKSPATGNVEFRVEVVGLSDSDRLDLAVLRFPPDELERFKKRSGLAAIPTLELGDSDTLRQADSVAIFGYPEDSDELKAIEGTVTGRQYLKSYWEDWFVGGFKFIEVGPAAVIQPGNSGGPALNSEGKVVGIPARGRWGGQQGWIIPSNIARHFIEQIYNSEAGDKALVLPDLGVLFAENFEGTLVRAGASEELVVFQTGIVIREVIKGSLAEKWDLENGDILVGFRNKDKRISAAVDFEGNTVTTGKLKLWPVEEEGAGEDGYLPNDEKRHLRELFLLSEPGDEVTLWYVRPGKKGLQKAVNKLEDVKLVDVPHLGTYDRPEFVLWGEFVAQEFNSYNIDRFSRPREEVLEGGVLVTYVEPNGLAHRRGMKIGGSGYYDFFSDLGHVPQQHWTHGDRTVPWVIIDEMNGKKIRDLDDLRAAIKDAEDEFTKTTQKPGYDPASKLMLPERYASLSFRTMGTDGESIRLSPTFPVDEAMETTEELLKNFKPGEEE
ncbi:trypsin-like peptidase domain-containing protein [Candidatus Poribacteria bacterium]|nr:trypsin-like peptidase domain-containing protein [Candidatus Poribacteria bacterium]